MNIERDTETKIILESQIVRSPSIHSDEQNDKSITELRNLSNKNRIS